MADSNDAKRDGNYVTSMLFVGSDGLTYNAQGDKNTGRLYVDIAGGSGTVTSISQSTGILLTPNPITTTGTVGLATNIAPIATLGSALQSIRVNAGATALEYYTPTAGTVTSVSGTANRITSTGGATPVIDIAATYVGQTSITTLGTIATGVWSGTAITLAKGGTGADLSAVAKGGLISGTGAGTVGITAVGADGSVLSADAASAGGIKWIAAPAASLVVGSTSISSGTTTRILYDNAGTLGEYTLTGTGTVVVMATSPTFTTGATTPQLLATSNDSGALGASGTAFSDLFLASGGIINFAAGNVTLTHSSGILTQNAGELRITSANVGTNADSVPTLSSTSTFTNKTLNGVTMTDATNIILNATTGTKIGTATTQKLGFYNATPIAQPTGDVITALQNLGLVATATIASAININTATESTDTSCFLVFVTASGTQTLPAKTNTTLTYNSNTNDLGITKINGLTMTASTGTFTLTNAKTLAVTNTLTLSGTDGTVMTFPSTSASIARTDAANTFTGIQTFNGNIQLTENQGILVDAALSADQKYSMFYGEAGTLGETVAFGEFVYLKAADSQWYKTDADATATAGEVKVGCCVVAGVDNDPTTIMYIGKIRADSLIPTLTIGAPVYLSTTAGAVQVAQPSGTDDVIRVIGYGNTADELSVFVSNDWITHT